MTTPVTVINKTNLTALDPNLAINQVADPALNKTVFDEIYAYFDTFVTAYNFFIASGAIATANMADLSVTTAKLALGSVGTSQLATGAVTSTTIGTGAVTSASILDGAIVDADINASAAITWSKISKTLSSLADLATRSAGDLNSGILPNARLNTGIPAVNIGNGDVTNAILSFLNTVSSNVQTQLDAKQALSGKGVANGYAGLDSGAKVPVAQLPDAVLGALEYQGTWNATTNSPTLTSTPTTLKGNYYVVSTAGTQFTISFDVGDWIVSNGAIWQKIDNTDAVSSFNSRLGAIVPAQDDYTFAQINKTISSLADLTTRSAADLSSGSLADARRGATTGDVTSPAGSAVHTIAALAVVTGMIASLAVTTAKLADNAVTTVKITDLNVTTAKLADGGVTTIKIADGNVTAAKLDPSILVAGIPLAAHIAANPIDHPDGSVTDVKIAVGVDAVKIGDGSVTNTEFEYINTLSSNAQTQLDSKVNITNTLTAMNALSNGAVGDIFNATMAASCNQFDILYLSSTGYNKAEGNVSTTVPCVAMALATGSGTQNVLKKGYVKNSAWTWTAGQLLYVSPTVAGGITSTLPSTSGQQVQIIGYAESATVVYFNPDYTFVQV